MGQLPIGIIGFWYLASLNYYRDSCRATTMQSFGFCNLNTVTDMMLQIYNVTFAPDLYRPRLAAAAQHRVHRGRVLPVGFQADRRRLRVGSLRPQGPDRDH